MADMHTPLDMPAYHKWLEEAARYFESRPTGGEDSAHWANVYNAENCRSFIRRSAKDAAANKTLRDALVSAANALESLSSIHDSNPSDALADMPPVEYARHMLFEARQMAKAAHSEARAALAGSAS